jgi:REP-associated tyrosine transposase
MSQHYNRLNHATWECKYHVVFTPKYRKKLLFGLIRRQLGSVFRELARRKECQIEEGHLMPDHVHMLITEIFGGGGDRVSEGEELDLDCAETRTQAAQFSGPQILGEGLLRFASGAERGDDSRLHQESGDGGQAVGSIANEACVLMKSQLWSQDPL